MPSGLLNPVIQFLRHISEADQVGESDRQLLNRFLGQRDEGAFAALVHRHSALVMGVCMRVLCHAQDAEDVFQATFLVLARKARSIRNVDSVASWLYGVAYRLATKARAQAARRQFHEQQAAVLPAPDPLQEIAWKELRPVLDEEINRLGECYRLPFILHYLEGRTNDEVARQLCCAVGTVGSRLARARQRLRDRLARRGLALSAGALATFLTAEAASATASTSIMSSTIQAALTFAAGPTAATASSAALLLAKGALRGMFISKFAAGVLVSVAVSFLGAGTGYLAYRQQAALAHATPAPQQPEQPATKRYFPAAYREGVLLFIGTEVAEGQEVPPDRLVKVRIAVKENDGNKEVLVYQERAFRRLREGDQIEADQLVAVLDQRLAHDDWQIKNRQVAMAIVEKAVSERTRDEAHQRLLATRKIYGGNPNSEELRGAEMTYHRHMFEALGRDEAINKAKAELRQVDTALQMHQIRSTLPGKIKHILKRPGEAVRALEPVVEIEVLD